MKAKFIFSVLALVLAFGVTGPKLIKMCQIRGWIPGAVVVEEVISKKWHQTPSQDPSERNTFWISWGDKSIMIRGNHRINLEEDDWEQIEVGQSIELTKVPGSNDIFLRDGIFASNGNFVFDIFLLLIELGVVFIFGFGLLSDYRNENKEKQKMSID